MTGGSCCTQPIKYLKALLFRVLPGASVVSIRIRIVWPRRAPSSPPISCRTTPSRQTMPSAASGTRARGASDAGGWGTACPVNVGHNGLARTACTDFFGTFCWPVGWPPRRVPVCQMGMSNGRGTLTVTFYDWLSWRVYRARRELRLRARAPLHTDQDDIW